MHGKQLVTKQVSPWKPDKRHEDTGDLRLRFYLESYLVLLISGIRDLYRKLRSRLVAPHVSETWAS